MPSMPLHVVLVTAAVRKIENGEVKFLMAQRHAGDDQAAGMWALPGGKVELDSGTFGILESTLGRELLEEVGITIQPQLAYISSQQFVRSSGDSVVSIVFMADWKDGEAQALDDQQAVGWFTISQVREKAAETNSNYLLPVFDQLERIA